MTKPIVQQMPTKTNRRQPIEYQCDLLNRVFYIKPLKVRKVLELYGDMQETRSNMDNIEAVLRLAQACIVNRDGTPEFSTLEECEEVIGDADVFLEIQDEILAAQGMSGRKKK